MCDYCKTPWQVTASIAAIILLISLLFKQTGILVRSVVGLMLCSLHGIILGFLINIVASIAPIALH